MLKSIDFFLISFVAAVFTLFAPTNAAFSRLDPGIMSQISGNQQLLQKVLMYHVLNEAFISLDWYNDKLEPTMQGQLPMRINLYVSAFLPLIKYSIMEIKKIQFRTAFDPS